MPKQALGKGLDALIRKQDNPPANAVPISALAVSDPGSGERVQQVDLARVVPSPLQPRKHFNEETLDDLVDSVREHGVIQPLIVREIDGHFELIAGERRWRAASRLDLKQVPVIVRVASDREVLEIALIENLQREDLNPIEEAEAYVRLARDFQMRQEDIAQRVGKNRATIANSMRLLDLHEDIRSLVAQARLSVGHAKAILGLKNHEEQKFVADNVVRRNLTVRATEKMVSQQLAPTRKTVQTRKATHGEVSVAVRDLEVRLQRHLATKVKIQHGEQKGRIEIEYYGNEDLDRIMETIGMPKE